VPSSRGLGCPETSVRNYHYSLRNDTEERSSHILRGGSLKSLVRYYLLIGWRIKCHAIDCERNTFLLLQKHLTSGTELILIGWKNVTNEEHVQCNHPFASQHLANEPLHSSQLFDPSLQKARGTTSLCGP